MSNDNTGWPRSDDPLRDLIATCRKYLSDEGGDDEFKQELQLAIDDCNTNELRAIADLVTTYALNLRGGNGR